MRREVELFLAKSGWRYLTTQQDALAQDTNHEPSKAQRERPLPSALRENQPFMFSALLFHPPLMQDHQPDLLMSWREPRPQTRIQNEWVQVKSMKRGQAKSQTSSQGWALVKETRKIKEKFIETAESYTTRKAKRNLGMLFKTSELKSTVAELKNIVNKYMPIKINFIKSRKF